MRVQVQQAHPKRSTKFPSVIVSVFLLAGPLSAEPSIHRIWLSHESDPAKEVTVSLEVPGESGQSAIEFGHSKALGESRSVKRESGRFQATLPRGEGALFYQIRSGDERSLIHKIKPYPNDKLRVVNTAN